MGYFKELNSMNEDSSPPKSVIVPLWKYIEPNTRVKLISVALMMVLTSVLEILSIGAFYPFLAILSDPEKILNNEYYSSILNLFGMRNDDNILKIATISFILIALLTGITKITLIALQTTVGMEIGTDLSLKAFRVTLYKNYYDHVMTNSSEILSASNKAANLVAQFIQPMLTLSSSILIAIGIIIALLIINTNITTILILVFGAIYTLLTIYTSSKVTRNGKIIARTQTEATKVIQEGLGSIRDVIINGSQEAYIGEYQKSITPTYKAVANNQLVSALPKYVIETLGICILASVAYIFLVINASNANLTTTGNNFFLDASKNGSALILPILGTFALGAQKLLPALQQIYASFLAIRAAEGSVQDVLRILSSKIAIQEYQRQTKIMFNGSIQLRNITFRFKGGDHVLLSNVNCDIPKGSKVGVVGKSGAGKTTFLDIMSGLLKPDSGEILVDNVIITDDLLGSWRTMFSYVPQRIFLKDASLEKNIKIQEPEQVSEERYKEILQTTGLDTLRSSGEQTLGEHGRRLSGGQLQRIGIARALYRSKEILVFDESTSALDEYTEERLLNKIFAEYSDRTIFIVSHRKNLLERCDILLTIENGELSQFNSSLVSRKAQ